MEFKELTLYTTPHYVEYLRNMAMVFWEELWASTLNEEQFKEKVSEPVEHGLKKVSY